MVRRRRGSFVSPLDRSLSLGWNIDAIETWITLVILHEISVTLDSSFWDALEYWYHFNP